MSDDDSESQTLVSSSSSDFDLKACLSLNRYEGTHDFRNLCKMDVGNGVLQFERTILSANIKPVDPQRESRDPHDLFVFEIKGLAFLYHQVSIELSLCSILLLKNVTSGSFKPLYSYGIGYFSTLLCFCSKL